MLKGIFKKFSRVLFQRGQPLEQILPELEEALILADVSSATTAALIEELTQAARKQRADGEQARELLKQAIIGLLSRNQQPLKTSGPSPLVYLMVGVNGSGKTTTIAKLAHYLRKQGKRSLLAAADTFRAAAIEQLEIWGQRANCEVVRHQAGGDPAAVVFDAIAAAKARGIECVIADTAGRLHTKRNLMEELSKIGRVVERELGRPADEVLLILDATTGQNALVQAQEFAQAVPLTGVVLTKLDGTAKGGTVISIARETGLPIKLVGLGEKLEDLEPFDAQEFAEALFE